MKKASVTFQLSIDIALQDHLDLDWVADSFLNSDRFSLDRVAGDPRGVTILAASSGVQKVVSYGKQK